MKNQYIKLGEKIKKERIRLGLTQTEFAKFIGKDVTKQKESRLENGKSLPDVFELQKIASVCGRPMEFFVTEDNNGDKRISDEVNTRYSTYSDDELRLISKIETISEEKRKAIEILLEIKKPIK
jgi:transcriptional regulator with XRE-family HTH domain